MRGKKFIGGHLDTMGFHDLTKFINGSGFKRRELKFVRGCRRREKAGCDWPKNLQPRLKTVVLEKLIGVWPFEVIEMFSFVLTNQTNFHYSFFYLYYIEKLIFRTINSSQLFKDKSFNKLNYPSLLGQSQSILVFCHVLSETGIFEQKWAGPG